VNQLRLSGSCYNHLEQLEHRLEFLMFVLKSSSLRVAQKTVGLLWKALVRQAYTPEARDLVLRWFGDALIPALGAGKTLRTYGSIRCLYKEPLFWVKYMLCTYRKLLFWRRKAKL
jgi:hypothetical protein